ncbi:MAG TPA: phenylalanine--tRNA ligase subunit beta [Chitinophagaceae bacterium]|nr:phenylalanine--tRNA ligase subunit beta [Chitinophagaceae bacterium]
MTISYKWLSDYLPLTIEPERLSRILTSIGLEVEKLERYEEVRGGLRGLVIGEVLEVTPHPNADKLRLTRVNTGGPEPLRIVCGAPNVAPGQKVVVALVGTTIYPVHGDPLTMKTARIRGEESQGMICAEDEIGLGESHAGILVLPAELKPGLPAADYFKPYEDWIYEIGLTPNRMDAMSHWGVARDVCAYLSYHEKKEFRPRLPLTNGFKPDSQELSVRVTIANTEACPRYSGLAFTGVQVGPSPAWLQQRLKAIGLRPINNVVDITNFIQHETGQPLHAFDAKAIRGGHIIVRNLPQGTPFVTLDGKERLLHQEDLMICDEQGGLCLAGVFGGRDSGVTEKTTEVFLESACFDPVTIRRSSFRHGLRTDAATRFEKGVDISGTVQVLKRAATLFRDLAGAQVASPIVDVYPQPRDKKQVGLKFHYLKKLSGKNYHPDAVKNILASLGFDLVKEGIDELWVAVPHHKPDIALPADIVEEILRIDGLDNVPIPSSIHISPAVEENPLREAYREKLSQYLVGAGFFEILTNSITNAAFYTEQELAGAVRMLNSLSAELDILRPSMLETGLQSIAHNLNRKNLDLRFFEFGKTYSSRQVGKYQEQEHLCLYLTGNRTGEGWRNKPARADFFDLKGLVEAVFRVLGAGPVRFEPMQHDKFQAGQSGQLQGREVVRLGVVSPTLLDRFDIRQPVLFADFDWEILANLPGRQPGSFREIPRFPAVQRDLALVVSRQLPYESLRRAVQKIGLEKLQDVRLFDIFESEKLGADRKSLAVSFTFQDAEKTLTDKEIDQWMARIMTTLEKEVQAEIRK